MSRRVLWFPALALLAACGIEPTQPSSIVRTKQLPSAVIADGSKVGGNPDFFWLFPMVAPPIKHPNYDKGMSDGSQRPDLFICALDATTVAQVSETTQCKSGGYSKSFLGITPGFRHASADDDIGQYHQWWLTPRSNDVFYRIRAKVGAVELGFIDVQTVTKLRDAFMVNRNLFTPQIDGFPMLIRFRIEQGALCFVEGACSTGVGVVNTKTGGTVVAPDGSGVEIPPQGPSGQTLVVTVSDCPDIPTDLPYKSACVRVVTNPPVTTLAVPATVWVCDGPPSGLSAQQTRYTMYRYDAPSTTTALPHADDQCPTVSAPVGAAQSSVKGMLADLVRGRFKSAGRQFAGLVGPRPLHASAVLDVGAGGFTFDFSDFQLVLPASMTKCAPWNEPEYAFVNQPFSDAATVCVTDVGGQAVAGATVRFATANGSVSSATVVTDAFGKASTTWTAGAAGPVTLTASGNGIGSTTNNGPRSGIDPFQPLSTAFGDASNGPAVTVLTGTETFNGTVVDGDVLPINYGSSGWSYQIDGTPPGDWFSSAASPFSATGAGAFGSANASCPLNAAGFNTPWAPSASTFLYARKTIALTAPAQLYIGVAIDNDVQVFVGGVDISGTNQQGVAPNSTPGAGFGLLPHEGCPTLDSFTFVTGVLPPGSHVIAFRALDRGISSYFDARVSAIVPEASAFRRGAP